MILHLANDFNHTKVHKELYSHLDCLYIRQIVFIPLRKEQHIGDNHFDFVTNDSEFVYSDRLKKYHKFFFKNKISFLYNNLLKKINISKLSLSHATTLFSDGAIAYKLFKYHNIPYIVTVRNTDIFTFFKYRKDLIPLALKILYNASKIVFVSESNRRAFNNLSFIKKHYSNFSPRVEVINNGINNYWLSNKESYEKSNSLQNYRFLFIGRFDKNKNIENLIYGMEKFMNYNKEVKLQLDVVGGNGAMHNKVVRLISSKKWINFHGIINDKTELKKIFKSVDFFSLISFYETFGLVYLEALSQGKPILFTEGQGVDFTFVFRVGEKVNPRSIDDISKKIKLLVDSKYQQINNIDFNVFMWKNIAKKYSEIYNQIIK